MCGSYRLSAEDSATISAILEEISKRYPEEAGYVQESLLDGPTTIFPDQKVPLLRGPQAAPVLMPWGYPGFDGGRSIINARGETVTEKRYFADSMRERRCIIPTSGFHEWDDDKKRHLFTLEGEDTVYLAGIYKEFDGQERCCIITTAPNDSVAPIHSRMPLVLRQEQLRLWLESSEDAAAMLDEVPPALEVKDAPRGPEDKKPKGTGAATSSAGGDAGQLTLGQDTSPVASAPAGSTRAESAPSTPASPAPRLSLYCDGGCRGNQGDVNVGGWGAYLIWGEHTKELWGGERNTTNNKMELTGAIEGLRAVKNKNVPTDVYLDSAYVLNGITSWVAGWQKNGWKNSKKEPVANKDLWLELIAEKEQFADISFIKVKGHADNAGNNMADALANRAMDEVEETGTSCHR